MSSRAFQAKRRAASLLEIILGLPLLLILLLAVVQFGMLQSNQQVLHMASRQAALVAAELAFEPTGPVPAQVVDAVNLVLRENGVLGEEESVLAWGGIRVDHSVAASSEDTLPFVLESGENPAPPPLTDYPRQPFVQVTVTIEATRLAPNTLKVFGIDFENRYVSQTSLYQHER